jgi:hypothetical protein
MDIDAPAAAGQRHLLCRMRLIARRYSYEAALPRLPCRR